MAELWVPLRVHCGGETNERRRKAVKDKLQRIDRVSEREDRPMEPTPFAAGQHGNQQWADVL